MTEKLVSFLGIENGIWAKAFLFLPFLVVIRKSNRWIKNEKTLNFWSPILGPIWKRWANQVLLSDWVKITWFVSGFSMACGWYRYNQIRCLVCCRRCVSLNGKDILEQAQVHDRLIVFKCGLSCNSCWAWAWFASI